MLNARIILIVLLLLLNGKAESQTRKEFNAVNRVVLQIPDSLTYSTQNIANYIDSKFDKQKEKAMAIFCWIVENIQYDYNSRYLLDNSEGSNINNERTLKTRRGVCFNYSNLYCDIAKQVGIKTYVITGYTKIDKKIDPNLHAWCASLIDDKWYMIDPSRGAGHIQNELFVKEIDYKQFMVKPERFIKTHIPFDPLWQFLDHTITKQEFRDGISKSKNEKAYFNFTDSIETYEKQLKFEQLLASIKRIESNGITNYLDYVYLRDAKLNYRKKDDQIYNVAVKHYNDGVYMTNDYIRYANNYFLPYKSDTEVKQMLNDINSQYIISLEQLDKIENPSPNLESNILQLRKSVGQELDHLENLKNDLDKYLEIAKKYRENLANTKNTEDQ
jgi:hypothetical protein